MANKEMKTLTFGDVTYEVVDEKARQELDTKGKIAYDHAQLKGKAFVSGFYKITTNKEGHVTSATPVTKEDIVKLGIPESDTNTTYEVGGDKLGLVKNGGNVTINQDGTMTVPEVNAVQSDWNATESNEGAIKNKPPIEKGKGENSLQGEDNIAIGNNSVTFGKDNVAGCMGFTIIAIDKNESSYTLDSTEGLEVGDVYSAYVYYSNNKSSRAENYGKITAINGNIVTVDELFCEGTFSTKESYLDQNMDTGQNSFRISQKPLIGTRALGNGAFAEGYNTVASAINAHAEGWFTNASGNNSHAEGGRTIASNSRAHAEGAETIASGKASHAEGSNTEAVGDNSHAEGRETTASGNTSHAEGYLTIASGNYQHVQGKCNIEDTENKYSHIVGGGSSDDYRSNIHTLDWDGNGWFAGGITAPSYIDMYRKAGTAVGLYSSALGYETTASGLRAHAEGYQTIASDSQAHAEGTKTQATGKFSHAEGRETIASGENSHSEGYLTIASGKWSHTEGYKTNSDNDSAHAEGSETTASGLRSHSEGYRTKATNSQAHAEGTMTIASGVNQHVQGKYNLDDLNNAGNPANKYANITGNGTSDTSRSNAHTLDWQGNAWYKGSVTSNGADYAEYFEWLDENPDNEDRVGLLVTLDGEKIRLANAGDEVLGIISGTAAVLGDNYECEWNGKYLTDDFGRIIYDMVEEFVDEVVGEDDEGNPIIEKQSLGFFKHPRINPDYDPEKAYVNRADRPEWDTVGMLGKLYVRDDGTCQVNGYATVGENGVATASSEKTNMRVLSRVNENVVRVLLK